MSKLEQFMWGMLVFVVGTAVAVIASSANAEHVTWLTAEAGWIKLFGSILAICGIITMAFSTGEDLFHRALGGESQ